MRLNQDPTPKDRIALEFLAAHRLVTLTQLAVRLGVTERTASWRISRLVTAGLALRGQLYVGAPDNVWITTRGLSAIESPLRAPKVRENQSVHRHDLGLAWLWLGAQRGRFGALTEIVSERTMRAADGHAAQSDTPFRTPAGFRPPPSGLYQPYGVGLGSRNPAGFGERHYPDLLLRTADGRNIAVELELSAKNTRKLRQVMRSYAQDNRIDAVVYFVPNAKLAERITAAAAAAGIGDRLHVRQFSAIEDAPGNGHVIAAARASAREAAGRAGTRRAHERRAGGRRADRPASSPVAGQAEPAR